MSRQPASFDPVAALAEVVRAPEADRLPALARWGAPREILSAIIDVVERLAVTEVSRALEAGEIVTTLSDKVGNTVLQSQARRVRAQALSYAGRFEEALPVFQEAVALADGAGAPLEAARARMSSLHALNSLGRFEESLAAGEAARQSFVALNEHELAARADSNLGVTLRILDRPGEALAHFDRARPHFSATPPALAQVDSNRAQVLLELDRFAEAEQAFMQALPVFETEQMAWAAAIVEGNLAELSTRQGDLQRAMFHFEHARRYLEQDESRPELARLAAERAEALLHLGLYDPAAEHFRAAVPELKACGFKLEAVRATAGLAQVLVRTRRFEEAEPLLAEASEAYAALGHATAEARLNLLRAELLTVRGAVTEAQRLLRAALQKLGDRPADAAVARYRIAEQLLAAGEGAAALAELDVAIRDAERLGVAPLIADLLHLRSRARRMLGQPAEAAVDLQRAVENIERVRGTLHAERFRAAFFGNRLAVYEDLVMALLDLGDAGAPAAAFQAIERAKSRSLLDIVSGAVELQPSEARDPGERELLEELRRRRAELNVLYSRLADAQFGEDTPESADRRRTEIRAQETALEVLESRLASARGAAALYAPPADLAQTQQRLPETTALVEYFAAGEELLALVVQRDRVEIFRNLGRTQEISERVQRLMFQIRRALRPGAIAGTRGARLLEDQKRELQRLCERLIAPLRTSLAGATRLVLVPHGVLHAVPFHALWDGEGYLIESFEIVHAPSASLLQHVRRPAAADATPARALTVGVQDELAPLVEDEARQVSAAVGGGCLLLDGEATVARVIAEAPHADLIHLATHGHFSAESPLASGIRLADGWLTVRDIFGLRLQAALVALSGCETGRSAVESGDELYGLLRGFLAAGATGVMVSLWAVQDRSTSEFMRYFYEAWRYNGNERCSAAEALRAAQLRLIGEQPHPAMWGPFILIGDV